jgi:hypothetical protein
MKAIFLSFVFNNFLEPGLFNGLRPIQLKKFLLLSQVVLDDLSRFLRPRWPKSLRIFHPPIDTYLNRRSTSLLPTMIVVISHFSNNMSIFLCLAGDRLIASSPPIGARKRKTRPHLASTEGSLNRDLRFSKLGALKARVSRCGSAAHNALVPRGGRLGLYFVGSGASFTVVQFLSARLIFSASFLRHSLVQYFV